VSARAARFGMLLLPAAFLCACAASPRRAKDIPLEPVTPLALIPPPISRTGARLPTPSEDLRRLSGLLTELGLETDPVRAEELFLEGSPASDWTRVALDAYVRRQPLQAVLFAQAAVGEDPDNEARRLLLSALARRTGVDADPQGLLPLSVLVEYELRSAEDAFFDRRFGSAAQHCRRALLLEPGSAKAWQKLGSALYAQGEEAQAREAYRRALRADPRDERLHAFLQEKGWEQ